MKNLLKAGIPAMMLVFALMAAGCEGIPETDGIGDAPYGITIDSRGTNKLVITITGDNDAKWTVSDTSVADTLVHRLFEATGTLTSAYQVTSTPVLSSSDKVCTITVSKKNSITGTITFTPHTTVNNYFLFGIESSVKGKTLNVKVTGSPITLTIN
jgi:hypothetical protein